MRSYLPTIHSSTDERAVVVPLVPVTWFHAPRVSEVSFHCTVRTDCSCSSGKFPAAALSALCDRCCHLYYFCKMFSSSSPDCECCCLRRKRLLARLLVSMPILAGAFSLSQLSTCPIPGVPCPVRRAEPTQVKASRRRQSPLLRMFADVYQSGVDVLVSTSY